MPDSTLNYELLKPKQEEFYDIDIINYNMDKIDTLLQQNKTNAIQRDEINKPYGVAGLNSNGAFDIKYGGTNAKTTQEAIYNLGAAPNRNILNNWCFNNTINQRGQTSYTGAIYGIDRWKGIYGSETVNIFDDRVQIVVSGNQGVGQYIEFPHLLANKRVTLSILWSLDGDYANFGCSNYFENFGSIGIEGSFALTLSSITFNIGDNVSQLKTVISGQGRINVYAVKLEIGESQTLARQNSNGLWDLLEIPDYQTELLKCQRYFITGPMEAIHLTTGIAFLSLPVIMRAKPEIIGNIALYTVNGNEYKEDSVITIQEKFCNGIVLNYQNIVEPCYIYFPPGTGLSAEL